MSKENRIDGWKEITAYMGIDRKTFLRRGYIVHYERTGCVYALKSELDAMMSGLVPRDSQTFPPIPIGSGPAA